MSTEQTLSLRTRGFFVLLLVTALTFTTLYSPQPLLSTIQKSYPGLSDATVALLMTVAMVPLSIAPLIYGSFLSSLDTRHVLQVCVSIMALASLGLWYSTSFAGLLCFRLAQGLVIPAILTCLMAHIAAKFQGAQLQRALAIYVGVTILGGLTGRLVAGMVATLWHWRDLFLYISVAQILVLLPLWSLRKPSRGVQEGQGESHGHKHIRMQEFREIFRIPGVSNLLFIEACGIFIYAAIASYLPFQLYQMSDMSDWRISLMYMGNAVGIVMAFSARRIAQQVGGETRAIFLGMGLYLCAMPGFLTGHALGIFLTMCLTCLGQFLAHSISPGLVNRMADKDKAAVNGLYLSVYYMGGALGSYVPGLVYVYWGWNGLIISLCALLVAALVAAWDLRRYAIAN